jgi:glycosyltransferase involved in cell wall biosynthesis
MSIFSIVIPAFNEEKGIVSTIERILEEKENIIDSNPEISDVEVIVVNDGSKDGTQAIVAQFNNVRLINHERNRGYGAALKTGFQKARGEYIGFLDADGTYPPEYFKILCRELIERNADIVIGSRFLGEETKMPFQRKVGNRFFAYILSWIVNKKISDTASGMRVFKKDILKRLLPLPDGLNLTPAMSTAALHENMKIEEVPMAYEARIGPSKLNAVSDGIRFLNSIISIARLYNPLKFFGLIGMFMIIIGLLLSINPIVYYLSVRRVESYEIYRLFTIMVLFVTGLNTITFGAFANYVLSIMHRREINQNSFLGRYLFNRFFLRRFSVIGWTLVSISILINYETIVEYIGTFHIYVHWSYIFTGATFFLVGIQMIMCSALIKILDELNERIKEGK